MLFVFTYLIIFEEILVTYSMDKKWYVYAKDTGLFSKYYLLIS